MITTGTTSMAIPSPLVSPFSAYTSIDSTYHAYFVFHATDISETNSYLLINASVTLTSPVRVVVLKHTSLQDCYVIDVRCPYYEHNPSEPDEVTYYLSGSITSSAGEKHIDIDLSFTQYGCNTFRSAEL